MTALGDKSELMRQSFVSQVSCKDFVFSGKMRLSSEILAKSFVFPALFSSLLPLWRVIAKSLSSHTSVYSVPIAPTISALELLYMAGCYASPSMMNQELHQHLGLDATNWKEITCSSREQNEGKGKDDTHPPALPVRMSYPISHPLMHVR